MQGWSRRWNELVVHRARSLAGRRAEQLIDNHHRLAQRDRGELDPRGHVTHCKHGRHTAAIELVDQHRAVAGLCHARAVQGEPFDVGHTTGGIEHRIDHHAVTVLQACPQAAGRVFDRCNAAVQAQVDTFLEHFRGQKMPHIVIETARNPHAPVKLVTREPRPLKMDANSQAMLPPTTSSRLGTDRCRRSRSNSARAGCRGIRGYVVVHPLQSGYDGP